jgi:hypothetical protein
MGGIKIAAAHGHPRAIFTRAIERGNVVIAEMAARKVGSLTLGEALALTALVAQKDPARRVRYLLRWLRRLLEEDECLTIDEAALAVSALAALGGVGTRRRCRRFQPCPNARLGSGARRDQPRKVHRRAHRRRAPAFTAPPTRQQLKAPVPTSLSLLATAFATDNVLGLRHPVTDFFSGLPERTAALQLGAGGVDVALARFGAGARSLRGAKAWRIASTRRVLSLRSIGPPLKKSR